MLIYGTVQQQIQDFISFWHVTLKTFINKLFKISVPSGRCSPPVPFSALDPSMPCNETNVQFSLSNIQKNTVQFELQEYKTSHNCYIFVGVAFKISVHEICIKVVTVHCQPAVLKSCYLSFRQFAFLYLLLIYYFYCEWTSKFLLISRPYFWAGHAT